MHFAYQQYRLKRSERPGLKSTGIPYGTLEAEWRRCQICGCELAPTVVGRGEHQQPDEDFTGWSPRQFPDAQAPGTFVRGRDTVVSYMGTRDRLFEEVTGMCSSTVSRRPRARLERHWKEGLETFPR